MLKISFVFENMRKCYSIMEIVENILVVIIFILGNRIINFMRIV